MQHAIKFERGKKVELKNLCGARELPEQTMNRIANRYAGNKVMVIADLKEVLPNEVKLGYGQSHIWCSNMKNERLFIIDGY